MSIIDGSTTTDSVIITVDVGTEPRNFRLNEATGLLYVMNSGGDDISVVDGATNSNTVVTTIGVGANPPLWWAPNLGTSG